ncbi:MAG TPA: hypothetical protein VHO03_20230 [Ignavibacteriales bacterium]|nr:hypothetical protein [Ignavibacteriales bacterium]
MAIIDLPPNHRRSLSVTAHFIEREMNSLEQTLLSGEDMITEKIEKSYNEPEREALIGAIRQLKELNKKMFYDLGLNETIHTEEQIVRAKAGHLWTILIDSTPKGLKGYGMLPPDQAEVLDVYVNNLLEMLKYLY